MKMNKKGSGMVWLYMLMWLTALGVMYVVMLYVFEGNLVPIIKQTALTTVSDPAAVAEINSGIDNYMRFFKILPVVLFFITIIYGIMSTIYQSQGNRY
jgi:hypothetical protein